MRTFSDNPDAPTPFEANALLVEYKGLNILIDGGGGGYVADQGTLPAQLEKLGLGVEDIDHVLITHGCASGARIKHQDLLPPGDRAPRIPPHPSRLNLSSQSFQ